MDAGNDAAVSERGGIATVDEALSRRNRQLVRIDQPEAVLERVLVLPVAETVRSSMHAEYRDRTHAGLVLARHLQQYADHDNLLVLALPRGGVPVAREVATALSAPLDVLVVRKLGLPGQEELAMGAIASGGVCILNRDILSGLAVSKETLDAVIDREQRELEQHERSFRGDQPPLDVRDKLIIIVDDGLATGATMRAAVAALRHLHPKQITVAVPLAPKDTIQTLQHEADAVVCPFTPEHFGGVGGWYEDFSQVSNDDVRSMLQLGRGD